MNMIETNLNFRDLSYGNNPNKLIMHHAEASNCTVESIHDWHKNGNGWAGIGYHYFVQKDGSIYTGRPVNAVGAHCPGQNSQSIGICAEGAYMSESMPVAQKNAIIELGKYLKDKYGISEVGGHRDYYSTDCPGTNYPLNEIKNAILSGSYSGSVSTSTTARNYMQVGDRGDNVKNLQNNLISLGYPIQYGADGIYGNATKEAVAKFQTANRLSSDGYAGVNTLTCIENLLKQSEEKTMQQAQKYDESIPEGDKIFKIPNTDFYIEQATDGRLIIHKDRGNYIALGKGFCDIYVNNNSGKADSKRILEV